MAQTAQPAQMTGMPPMLAYTIRSPIQTSSQPWIRVGQGNSARVVTPNQIPADNSYWIVILDANKPATKVQDWVVPGMNNTTVPSNLDQYMSNPAYLFAVVTQTLVNASVPQGAFYNYLAAHGAGPELQKLEQSKAALADTINLYLSRELFDKFAPGEGPQARTLSIPGPDD